MEPQRLTSTTPHQQAVLDVEEQQQQLTLKKSVSCHPMFSLLKDAHLNCLKVCAGDEMEIERREDHEEYCRGLITMESSCSELDLFMESYYFALVELKRAMREPMKEASEFIAFMQDLLLELQSSPPLLPMASLHRGGGGGDQVVVEAARVTKEEKLEIVGSEVVMVEEQLE